MQSELMQVTAQVRTQFVEVSDLLSWHLELWKTEDGALGSHTLHDILNRK